jgi:uncharacterized membrane protein YdjX (TVP38/TMEM64 family)
MTEQTTNSADDQPSGGMTPGRIMPLLIIVVGLITFFVLGGHEYLSFATLAEHRGALLEWYAANALLAAVGFWAFYALAVAFSLPGAVWLTLMGGFIFGTGMAMVLTISSATVGAALIFLAARYALADYLHAKAGGMVRKMEDGFRENAFSYLLVLRLVPIFPFWLVNLVPALLGMRFGSYTLATFIGIIPGSFVYCSLGNGLGALFEQGQQPDLGIIFQPDVLTPIVGLAVLSLVPVVYKKLRARKGHFDKRPVDKGPADNA